MTALGTAAGQNLTAILGGHAGTETVGTLAVQDAGLEGALHGGSIRLNSVGFFWGVAGGARPGRTRRANKAREISGPAPALSMQEPVQEAWTKRGPTVDNSAPNA